MEEKERKKKGKINQLKNDALNASYSMSSSCYGQCKGHLEVLSKLHKRMRSIGDRLGIFTIEAQYLQVCEADVR